MATTAQRVFDLAIGLMGATEGNGLTDTSTTAEYKGKTLLILNALRGELYPYSDKYKVTTGGTRPVMEYIADFNTPLDIDDVLAQTVLPYGLAAHLLADENVTLASFLLSRYEDLRQALRYGPSEFEEIEKVYGGIDSLYGR